MTDIDKKLIKSIEDQVIKLVLDAGNDWPQYKIAAVVCIADDDGRDHSDPEDFGNGHKITAISANRTPGSDLVLVEGLNAVIRRLTE